MDVLPPEIIEQLSTDIEGGECQPGSYEPVPGDCTKFANCWKGNPIIQSCGPGTHFNPTNSVCDWPSKANCNPLDFQDDDQEDEIIVPDQSDVDDIGTVQFLMPKMHFFQSYLSLNLT